MSLGTVAPSTISAAVKRTSSESSEKRRGKDKDLMRCVLLGLATGFCTCSSSGSSSELTAVCVSELSLLLPVSLLSSPDSTDTSCFILGMERDFDRHLLTGGDSTSFGSTFLLRRTLDCRGNKTTQHLLVEVHRERHTRKGSTNTYSQMQEYYMRTYVLNHSGSPCSSCILPTPLSTGDLWQFETPQRMLYIGSGS